MHVDQVLKDKKDQGSCVKCRRQVSRTRRSIVNGRTEESSFEERDRGPVDPVLKRGIKDPWIQFRTRGSRVEENDQGPVGRVLKRGIKDP